MGGNRADNIQVVAVLKNRVAWHKTHATTRQFLSLRVRMECSERRYLPRGFRGTAKLPGSMPVPEACGSAGDME